MVRIEIKEDDGQLYVSSEIVQKFPSKHFGHTILDLGCGDKLVTVSHESIEYWDFVRKKRMGLFHCHFGENLAAICLNSESNSIQMSKIKELEEKEQERLPSILFQSTKILTVEDSRIMRVWNPKRYLHRVLSKHNDVVTKVLKISNISQKKGCYGKRRRSH